MGGHKRKIFILELPMNFSLRFCNPKLLTGCGVLIFFVVFLRGTLVSSKQLNPHGVAINLACVFGEHFYYLWILFSWVHGARGEWVMCLGTHECTIHWKPVMTHLSMNHKTEALFTLRLRLIRGSTATEALFTLRLRLHLCG